MEQEYSRSAAKNNPHIEPDPSQRQSLAELIDQETGVREALDLLENIIAEAGDLIESRNPELVARARAAVRHMRMKTSDKLNDSAPPSLPA